MKNEVTIIILAGGQGTRMGGRDKAFLRLSKQPLISRKLGQVSKHFSHRIIVTNNATAYPQAIEAQLVPDEVPGQGPLMGVYSGLKASRTEINFVTAVDMPFFSSLLYNRLLEKMPGAQVVAPCGPCQVEPLFALYSRECLGPIMECLAKGQRRLVAFWDQVSVGTVPYEDSLRCDPSGQVFANINAPSDLQTVQALLNPAP